MNVLKVIDLAVLLDALQQRLEAHLDVVPVIQSRIGYDGTVNSKEVETGLGEFRVLQGARITD